MKVSVSLPDDDVDFLDSYVREHDLSSRSAALHRAVRLLRSSLLEADYAEAYAEWAGSVDEEAWDSAAADVLDQ